MVIKSGTVAFWRDLYPGSDKFVYLLGVYHDSEYNCDSVAYFTISSQTRWAGIQRTRREMLDIPRGTADYLTALSYIQCWWELGRDPLESFRELERRGCIMYRGELPQFLSALRSIVEDSDVLSSEDIERALAALDSPPPKTQP